AVVACATAPEILPPAMPLATLPSWMQPVQLTASALAASSANSSEFTGWRGKVALPAVWISRDTAGGAWRVVSDGPSVTLAVTRPFEAMAEMGKLKNGPAPPLAAL